MLYQKFAVEKFDETYARTNEFVNELVSEGEKLEKELQEKIDARGVVDERVKELKAKLGLDEVSETDKIEELTAKVDNLTVKITKLVKSREAKKAPVKRVTAKKTTTRAKTAVKKTAGKAPGTSAAKKAAPKAPVVKAKVETVVQKTEVVAKIVK